MESESFENSSDEQSHKKKDLDDGLQDEQKSDIPIEQNENLEGVSSLVSSLIEVVAEAVESDKAEENEQKSDVSTEHRENIEVIRLVSNLLEEVSEKTEVDDNVEDDKTAVSEQKSDSSAKQSDILEVARLVSSLIEGVSEDDRDSKIKRQKDLTTRPLSTRLEYLSRPRKDSLDNYVDFRLEGALPENAYPSWRLIPLPTKIPFDNCPISVTKTKLGTNLFLPPPGNDFDLADENNLRLPSESYENMHDPKLKKYFDRKCISERLRKEGFITESKNTICSLSDINRYRVYQRRILAAELQKTFRDQDEELKKERAKEMEEQIKKDMQSYHESRTQGKMRRRIKDTITSIKDSSMENQMKRDIQVLNCLIRRQNAQKKRVEAVDKHYKKIFDDHMKKKYSYDEKRKKKLHLAYAEEDLKRLEHLCQVQEKAKLERKQKLDEFWKRKSDWQKEWIKKGEELERIREEEKQRNIEILQRTGKLPLIFLKEQEKDPKKGLKGKEKSKASLKEDETMQIDKAKELDTSPSREKQIEANLENAEAKQDMRLSKSETYIDEGAATSDKAEVKDVLSDSSLISSDQGEIEKLKIAESAEEEKNTQPEISKDIDTSLPNQKDTGTTTLYKTEIEGNLKDLQDKVDKSEATESVKEE